MPRSASRRVTAAGTVDPPRPTVLKCDMCSAVQSGWSSRLVTKYGGPPPIDSPSLLDELEHLARIPHVAQVDRRTLQHRDQERAEHADEVPDRGGGELAAAVGRVVRQQLAGLEAQRLMAVDDALRVACRARGEGDQRRARRIGGDRARSAARRRAGRRRSSCPTRPTMGTSAHRSGWIFHPPEFLGGDERLRARDGR